MLPPVIRRIADAPRDKLLWTLIGVLLVGQIVAFWMLCLQQVRKAEVRHATIQIERMAVADCMRYIPKATTSACNARVNAQQDPPNNLIASTGKQASSGVSASTAMSSATPVSFNFR